METELLPSSVTVEIDKKNKTVKYYYTNAKGKKTLIDLSEPTSQDIPSAPISERPKKRPKTKKS